jgi:predicted ATPase
VALAVAEQVLGSFRDGVWLVDLALLRDVKLVPNAIAMATGLAVNSADMLAALCDHLREREMLLVLDSCEHVAPAAARFAARILANATGMKLVVTSGEPLRLAGERVRGLPGLGMPASSALTADEALQFAGVQLFVDRAAETLESFELNDDDAGAVAEICSALEGLPSALEIAATRVNSFTVSDLLHQIARQTEPRQRQTLTSTLDWTIGLSRLTSPSCSVPFLCSRAHSTSKTPRPSRASRSARSRLAWLNCWQGR